MFFNLKRWIGKILLLIILPSAIFISYHNSESQAEGYGYSPFTYVFPGGVVSLESTSSIWGWAWLGIFEKQRLNFGTIDRPSIDVLVTVDFQGNLSGSATFLDTSTGAAGAYGIIGSSYNTISISATQLETYPLMKYAELKGRYPYAGTFSLTQGASNLVPPGWGRKLEVAGSLKVAAGIPAGHYSPEFVISVNYD